MVISSCPWATKSPLSARRDTGVFLQPAQFCASRILLPLHSYTKESIIFAKIFRLRVCSTCQYLILWQRAVRSPQSCRRSIVLDNLPGTRYGDRHHVRHTDQERSTSHVQLSNVQWVTERAHGGRDMGTDTQFGRPDSWPGGPDQAPLGRSRRSGTPRYGDRHDVRYTGQERST